MSTTQGKDSQPSKEDKKEDVNQKFIQRLIELFNAQQNVSGEVICICCVLAQLAEDGFVIAPTEINIATNGQIFFDLDHDLLKPKKLRLQIYKVADTLWIHSLMQEEGNPDEVRQPIQIKIDNYIRNEQIEPVIAETSHKYTQDSIIKLFGETLEQADDKILDLRYIIQVGISARIIPCFVDVSAGKLISEIIRTRRAKDGNKATSDVQNHPFHHQDGFPPFPHSFNGPHQFGPQFGPHQFGHHPPFPVFPNASVGEADRLPAGIRGQLDTFEEGQQGTEMGPNHPIFHGGWGRGGFGRGGYDGFFPPPGSIPPGARWDPVHPGQLPFRGRGGGRGGRGNAPGSEPFNPSPDDNMFI